MISSLSPSSTKNNTNNVLFKIAPYREKNNNNKKSYRKQLTINKMIPGYCIFHFSDKADILHVDV